MAFQILIRGEDRTSKVQANSLVIRNVLTRKRDTCDFNVLTHTGDTYKPSLGNEVVIYDGATKIFGGIIVKIDSAPNAYSMILHKISCQDYTRLLDKKLVPDSFTNQTVNEIIATLKDLYFPTGFTINNVDCDVPTRYIAFKYKPLAKCIEELANLVNYDWYVDYDKDVHFFAKETMTSPFDLADDTGKYEYNSLVIRKDNSQIRNSIVVRGGEYLGSQTTFQIQTNGVDSVYPLPYKFTDFGAHLTGHVLNVGIDNINIADNYDALFNFQEKIIRFKEADKPTSGKTLYVSGKPNLPVIVKYKSQPDINAMASVENTLTADSHYEYLIEDKSINSKEGARQRARAEIVAYATTLSEGEFITTTSGLRAGQSINVVSASRGISETFIINQVTVSQFSTTALRYAISLITTRTFDLIDILQRLLLEGTKKIEIDPNETIDLVEGADEIITITDALVASLTHNPIAEVITFNETFTAQSLNYAVKFVAGPWTPTLTKRVFIIEGSRLG